MFFIQMLNASGTGLVNAGFHSSNQFGVPITNLADVGVREGSKVRCMRLGNNLSVVTMEHDETGGVRFDDKVHPLKHRSFFSGYDAPADDRTSSTTAAESTVWTRNAMLSYGSGSSFSGTDVLSYAAGSALAGGGSRVQVGSSATEASPSTAPSRMSASTDRAGPSLAPSAAVGGPTPGHGDRGSTNPLHHGASGADKGSAAGGQGAGLVNGVPLDPTLQEDPILHWGNLGMFQGVMVDLTPSLKAHLTETIYGLAMPREEVDGVTCPYGTMYYHNALAEIAKETYYLGSEHDQLMREQRQPKSNNGGVGSDWDFVMGMSSDQHGRHGGGALGSGASSPTQSSPSFTNFASGGGNAHPSMASTNPPSAVCLSAPPAIEAETANVENQLGDTSVTSFMIVIGSDMGYTPTTLYRVGTLISEMAIFLGYPNNLAHLGTVVKYIRKLMLDGNLSFMEQSRERLLQKSTADYDSMLRDVTSDYSERVTNGRDAMGSGARHPVYSSIMMGDKIVAETSPLFTSESLQYNNQSKGDVWASDKYLVQLMAAANYSIPTLGGDLITPQEWRIKKLEEGLAKFGVTRYTVTTPKTRDFMIRYLRMMGAAMPVAAGSSAAAAGFIYDQNQHQQIRNSINSTASSSAATNGAVTTAELRLGNSDTPIPLKDKAAEENASSIYGFYFDELLKLCDPNIRTLEEEDTTDEEGGDYDHSNRNSHDSGMLHMGGAAGGLSPSAQSLSVPRHGSTGGGLLGSRLSMNQRFSVFEPSRVSGASSYGVRESSINGRRLAAPVVVDDSLKEAMASRNLRASMRMAASHGDRVRTSHGQPAQLSLKRTMKIAKGSRRTVDNIIPRCSPYHDPCRFLPPVRSVEVPGFEPDHGAMSRPDVVYTAVISGILLRGYDMRDAVLQLDFFPMEESALEEGQEECPKGYSAAFLYCGLTASDRDRDDDEVERRENELRMLSVFDDDALRSVDQVTYDGYRMDFLRAQWLTSPTVESYGIPGLIHFACVDRRQNTCVAANFDAAIRNAADADIKIGNRMLHEMMVQNMSRAHELIASGYSEGLWGHLGVQFFYCVGLLPSENRLMMQQQALTTISASASAAASRAGSPEAQNPYGGGGGRAMRRNGGAGGFGGGGAAFKGANRSNYTQSVFVDAQTISALTNSSFAGSVYSASGGRPSMAIEASQMRGSLLFPERGRLPLQVLRNLLYRPYLIPDEAHAPVVEFYGLFVGAMSPSEVCDAVEMLWGKIFE